MTNNSKKWNLDEIVNNPEGYENSFENISKGPASFNKRVEDVKKMCYGNNNITGEVILDKEGTKILSIQEKLKAMGAIIIDLYLNSKTGVYEQVFSSG